MIEKVTFCGPRGLWITPQGTFFGQVVKYVLNEFGTQEKFVLAKDGEWRRYDKNHAFQPDECFNLSITAGMPSNFTYYEDKNGR